jgi:putative transcriptional regulator
MTAEEHRVQVRIDELIAARGLTLTELAARVGLTLANLSVLKNGRARAVRFTTLTALCDVLECQPGDLLSVSDASSAAASSSRAAPASAAASSSETASSPEVAPGGADSGQRKALTRR